MARYIEGVCKGCHQPRYCRAGNGLCKTCHDQTAREEGIRLANRVPNPWKA